MVDWGMFCRQLPFRIEYRDAAGALQWSERLWNPHDVAVKVALLAAEGITSYVVFRDNPVYQRAYGPGRYDHDLWRRVSRTPI